jgi:hypothetical protein
MARSAVTVTKMLLYNTPYAVTADAAELTDDHVINASKMKHDRLLIRFLGGTTKYTATIKAGDFSDSSLGNLAIEVDTTATKVVCIDSARFLQSDGTIEIDLASVGSGAVTNATIEAYLLP